MICELDRNPVGLCKTRGRDGIGSSLAFHHLHLTLHFADCREVFIEFAAVGCAKAALKATRVVSNEIDLVLDVEAILLEDLKRTGAIDYYRTEAEAT